MFLEALEILNSAGQDEDTFVTDFGIYKITYILTVYLPIALSTFLLSQEYLGDKIACFAPDSFSENHAEALNEYCWNNGFWLSPGVLMVKNLYTQPHRFYPLYLPVQAVLFTSPIVLWNILTKSHLLAVLRGTEEFLQDLLDVVQKGQDEPEDTASKAKELMKQFHQTCVQAAQQSQLAKIGIVRVSWEMFLLIFTLCLQFFIYNHKVKEYQCSVPEIDATGTPILCTVPILDLLDAIWSFNLSALLLALALNMYMVGRLYQMHFSEFQPLFYNSLPYGDGDDFNEKVTWDSRWTKDSYRLLTRIFQENNSIMTKAYVLMAMKPQEKEELSEREKAQQERLKRLQKVVQREEQNSEDEEDEESDVFSKSTKQRAPLLRSTNGRIASFESTNGRAGSFASTNGRAASYGSTNGRAGSFASTNGRLPHELANGRPPLERTTSHVIFPSANGSQEAVEHGSVSHSKSSGRGSWSVSNEDYSSFQPLANSSIQDVHFEQNGSYSNRTTYRTTLSIDDVVDLQSRDLRRRQHVLNGDATVTYEELDHK